MDKDLQNMYETELLNEYYQGERKRPVKMIPNQVSPQDAGSGLSYKKQTIGMAPANIVSHVYEGEEESEILSIIDEVEAEYNGESHINNAVKMALGKIRAKLGA